MGSVFPRRLKTGRAIFLLIKVEILRSVLRPVISEIGAAVAYVLAFTGNPSASATLRK